jgi:hypothetical protein
VEKLGSSVSFFFSSSSLNNVRAKPICYAFNSP